MRNLVSIFAVLCFAAGVASATESTTDFPAACDAAGKTLQDAERKINYKMASNGKYPPEVTDAVARNESAFTYLKKALSEFTLSMDRMGTARISPQQADNLKKMLDNINASLGDADDNQADPQSLYKQHHFESLPETDAVKKVLTDSLSDYNAAVKAAKNFFKGQVDTLNSAIAWHLQYGK